MYYALIFFKQNLIYKNTYIHTCIHTTTTQPPPQSINQNKPIGRITRRRKNSIPLSTTTQHIHYLVYSKKVIKGV